MGSRSSAVPYRAEGSGQSQHVRQEILAFIGHCRGLMSFEVDR